MKSISCFIALIAIMGMMYVQDASSASSCSAVPAVPGAPGCNISCSKPGERAYCKSGMFSADCKCVGVNDPNPPLVNPTPTSEQYAGAAAFASFLGSSSSANLRAMEASVNDASTGASTQNWSLYWAASDSFFDQYNNLSSTDKDAINTWRASQGWTEPLP